LFLVRRFLLALDIQGRSEILISYSLSRSPSRRFLLLDRSPAERKEIRVNSISVPARYIFRARRSRGVSEKEATEESERDEPSGRRVREAGR
jgi:hypothetical protein